MLSLRLFCWHKNIVINKLKKTKKLSSEKKIKLLGSSNPKDCAKTKINESNTEKIVAKIETAIHPAAYLNVNFSRRISSITNMSTLTETTIDNVFVIIKLSFF